MSLILYVFAKCALRTTAFKDPNRKAPPLNFYHCTFLKITVYCIIYLDFGQDTIFCLCEEPQSSYFIMTE